MSERLWARIRIGGTIKRSDVADFVRAINAESPEKIDNDFINEVMADDKLDSFCHDDTISHEGGIIQIVDSEATRGAFYAVETFCQEHKVSFCRETEGGLEFDPEQVHFRPDLPWWDTPGVQEHPDFDGGAFRIFVDVNGEQELLAGYVQKHLNRIMRYFQTWEKMQKQNPATRPPSWFDGVTREAHSAAETLSQYIAPDFGELPPLKIVD